MRKTLYIFFYVVGFAIVIGCEASEREACNASGIKWSDEIHGLRARLIPVMKLDDTVRKCKLYLEFSNETEHDLYVGYGDPGQISLSITKNDAKLGRSLERMSVIFHSSLLLVKQKSKSRILITQTNSDFKNGTIDLGDGGWTLGPGNYIMNVSYTVDKKFFIPPDKADLNVWYGSLPLPPVRFFMLPILEKQSDPLDGEKLPESPL